MAATGRDYAPRVAETTRKTHHTAWPPLLLTSSWPRHVGAPLRAATWVHLWVRRHHAQWSRRMWSKKTLCLHARAGAARGPCHFTSSSVIPRPDTCGLIATEHLSPLCLRPCSCIPDVPFRAGHCAARTEIMANRAAVYCFLAANQEDAAPPARALPGGMPARACALGKAPPYSLPF